MPYIIPLPDFGRFLDVLQHFPDFVFLGSTAQGGNPGRFSIVSAMAERQWVVRAGDEWGNHPGNALRRIAQPSSPETEGSSKDDRVTHFQSGVIGILFYEAGYRLNPHLDQATLPQDAPLYWAGDFAWSAVYNHQSGDSYIHIEDRCPATTVTRILGMLEYGEPAPSPAFELVSRFKSEVSRTDYHQKVDRIRAYLGAGDCYQVNLSQRFMARFQGSTWEVFKHLCDIQPSPYSAYLKTPFGNIISISPEQYLGVEGQTILTRPIKGTRPRGATPGEDQALARQLETSEKDQAENLMIVDLLRNDLGRFCVPGSVEVTELFGLESYTNVHHLVSTIRGKLDKDIRLWDVLTGCFPGGSITGAPKIRAMQIIRELESHWRGPYCGSVFYISDNGIMDSSIAIRTLLAKDDQLYCWGGGGVVMDSDPEAEYQESIVKVQRLMRQIESLGSI